MTTIVNRCYFAALLGRTAWMQGQIDPNREEVIALSDPSVIGAMARPFA
jgi:hypothetical protein